MASKFALVDYHKGNIKSVDRGLAGAGADVVVTDGPDELRRASAIVLPGVGAFTDAMRTLDELGLTQALKERIGEGVPFLGICLGQHLMFEGGVEHAGPDGPTPGLGIVPGVVERMPNTDADGRPYKVPHVGWNSLEVPRVAGAVGAVGAGAVGAADPDADALPSPLFDGIEPGEFFYFTHSYISPASPFTISETTHSVTFPSAIRRGNAYGVQFHPEKSSTAGARLLANFVKLAS